MLNMRSRSGMFVAPMNNSWIIVLTARVSKNSQDGIDKNGDFSEQRELDEGL